MNIGWKTTLKAHDKQWNAREWDPCQLNVDTVFSKNFSPCIIPFLSAPVKKNTPCEM